MPLPVCVAARTAVYAVNARAQNTLDGSKALYISNQNSNPKPGPQRRIFHLPLRIPPPHTARAMTTPEQSARSTIDALLVAAGWAVQDAAAAGSERAVVHARRPAGVSRRCTS